MTRGGSGRGGESLERPVLQGLRPPVLEGSSVHVGARGHHSEEAGLGFSQFLYKVQDLESFVLLVPTFLQSAFFFGMSVCISVLIN